MRILYTTCEGGHWRPMEIKPPKVHGEDMFAICLPDGTIWDKVVHVDEHHRIEKDEFDTLFNKEI